MLRIALAFSLACCLAATLQSQVAGDPVTVKGMLKDGTVYNLVKPEAWNGTVFVDLDSGGLNSDYAKWLYARGIARAGTSRNITAWHIDKAIDNQAEVLGVFAAKFGAPKRAVTWGTSLGGLVAAGTAQKYADRFVGASPHCGALAGSLSFWNTRLDTAFVLKALLAPTSMLPIVNVPADVEGATKGWQAMLAAAQATPAGRARIALAAAVGQVPSWTSAKIPEPQEGDAVGREAASFDTVHGTVIGNSMSSRRQFEEAVGGVASWNTGVDYAALLQKAYPPDRQMVAEMYRRAGLDLQADLRTLEAAPRIAADPAVVEIAKKNVAFDGKLRIPVAALNITGDTLAWSVYDSAYDRVVKREGRADQLRLTYVHGPGHCGFTGAERIAVFDALLQRLDSGKWPDVSAASMNARAAAAGVGMARFVDYVPPVLNRVFFANDLLPANGRSAVVP